MAVRALLAGLVAGSAAVAAPVPKETPAERMKRLFGAPVDPAGDCGFGLDKQALRIAVPGAPHPLRWADPLGPVPRVLRPGSGDFTAEVRVRVAPPPRPGRPPAGFKAGLLVAAGADHFLYHGVGVDDDGDAARRTVEHGYRPDGGNGAATGTSVLDPAARPAAVVRVVRVGQEVELLFSPGGDDWYTCAEYRVDLPDAVSIGVFAANWGATSFAAEFDDFRVTPLGPAK